MGHGLAGARPRRGGALHRRRDRRRVHHDERLLTPARRTAAFGALLAGAYASAVLVVIPLDGPVLCPFRRVTGLHCPGCGATRASWHLLHGEVVEVLRHNLLLVPVLALLVARWVHLVAPAATSWLPRWVALPVHTPRAVVRGIVAAFVVYGVVRNLPGPDAWLTPPS